MKAKLSILASIGVICFVSGLLLLSSSSQAQSSGESYVGSSECRDCHRDTAKLHELSVHDLAAFDATDEDYADAILGDFNQSNPLLEATGITREDIAFAIGAGRDSQQYVIETDDGQFELMPLTWDADNSRWIDEPHHTNIEVTGDFLTDCATCHTTGYDPDRGSWRDDGVSCESCHGPGEAHVEAADDAGGSIDEEELQAIQAAIAADIPNSCTTCHRNLTHAYAVRFTTQHQQDVLNRLRAIDDVLATGQELSEENSSALEAVREDPSKGIHNVSYTSIVLNSIERELGLLATSLANNAARPVTNPDSCVECHAQEHESWLQSPHANASLQDRFREIYSLNGRPGLCLNCHASGYDPNTGNYAFEGVVCSNCHVIEGDHPPSPASVSVDSTACASCHSGGHASVYEEWLVSDHSVAGVDCIDCHDSHSNGLMLGDVNSTCGDCHADAMNDEVHMGAELVCTDCHMTPRHGIRDASMITVSGHDMQIDPRICADCHGSTHSLKLDNDGSIIPSDTLVSLNEEIERLTTAADDNLINGVIGGVVGVMLILGLIYIVLRLGRMS